MSNCSRQSIANRWQSILTVIAAWIACWSTVPSASAQKSESPLVMASLSVSTSQPEFMLTSVREQPDRPVPRVVEGTDWPLLKRRHKKTDAEAWEKFEAEYRPEPRSPPVKRQIEAAKYGLDTSVFAVDRFVKSIRDHADFEFDRGRLQRTGTNTREGFLDNPRVKLDLEMLRGKPYAGVRLVIPFGN